MVYATFWQRFAALIIDSALVTAFTLTLTYYNVIHWKNFPLFAIVSLISIAYKPFFENKYGASLGKKALRLKVVTFAEKKPRFAQILLRNIFNILPGIISIYLMSIIFNQPEFAAITTYKKYARLITHSGSMNIFNNSYMVLYFADAIFLWMDDYNRSLHDRIGKTIVIRTLRNTK